MKNYFVLSVILLTIIMIDVPVAKAAETSGIDRGAIITLHVGDSFPIIIPKEKAMKHFFYLGMPSDHSFSIQTDNILFFSSNEQEISFWDYRLSVIEINPEKIVVQFIFPKK
jgi:hypothetical protein